MSEKGTILVIDDEIDLLKVLTARLTKAGYGIVTARDGLEARVGGRGNQYIPYQLELLPASICAHQFRQGEDSACRTCYILPG